MKKALSIGLGLALAAATPAVGQSPSEFAIQEARSHGENLFSYSSGWRVDQGPLTGSLSDGAAHTVDVRLQGGERYGIIGGCDQDCSDMDLEITDQSGNSLDSDYLTDDFPMLEVSASYSGTYRMRVSMPSCSVSPCYYAYIVYRMSGGGGGGSYTDVARNDLARREAQFFPSGEGWSSMGGTGTSSLRDGDSESFRLSLDEGVEYGVLATCDQDCTDIDLEVTDRGGNSLDSDYLTDDFPILQFRAGYSGDYTLQVSMPGCSVSPCYYAYQVYRRTGGGGGAASTVDRNTSYAQQARQALERHVSTFFPRSEGWSITDEAVVRTLTDGSSEDLTLSLSGGVNYGIIATCDEDCDDIDLYVYDEAGNELDSDTLADDYPVLNFRTPYSGTFSLRVRMYDCSVNPCYYAYEVYRR